MDRGVLQDRIAAGATLRELAAEAGVDRSTMRRWLRRMGLATNRMSVLAQSSDARAAGASVLTRTCETHGEVEFGLDGRGFFRCSACNVERVAARRRAVKATLVAEAGGRCVICGYDRCAAALHFHHLDRRTKKFHLGHKGVARSLAKSRAEAAKCVLLCASCHAEVEMGLVALPVLSDAMCDPG